MIANTRAAGSLLLLVFSLCSSYAEARTALRIQAARNASATMLAKSKRSGALASHLRYRFSGSAHFEHVTVAAALHCPPPRGFSRSAPSREAGVLPLLTAGSLFQRPPPPAA